MSAKGQQNKQRVSKASVLLPQAAGSHSISPVVPVDFVAGKITGLSRPVPVLEAEVGGLRKHINIREIYTLLFNKKVLSPSPRKYYQLLL